MNYLTTNDFDTLFDNMFSAFGARNSRIPQVDIYEDKDAYYIDAELAGYEDKDVDVNVDKHVLHISSTKTSKKDDRKYLIRERNLVSFDRSFSLPESVNEEAIEASFKNGVLNVKLPKMPVEQPKRISVKIA